MAETAAIRQRPAADGLAGRPAAEAATLAWIVIALLLSACVLGGYSPTADLDDLLKYIQVRAFLDSGAWFDRTVPGILQPEPFVSHWVRLADVPYAALTWALAPFAGLDAALGVATFAVPLLLLWPVLHALRLIVGSLGFARPDAVFALALPFIVPALFEFAPDRIDYHNLEMALLLGVVALAMAPPRPATAAALGAVTALALAISLEFALFLLLPMALAALDFVRGEEGAGRRLAALGAALATTAAAAFLLIVPPGSYGTVACDVYSAPHLFALAAAGLSFVLVALAGPRLRRPMARAALLGALAAASVAALTLLFPECLGSPYGGLSAYARQEWLEGVLQEKSILQRPEIVLSSEMAGVSLIMGGALAPAAFALRERGRDRNLLLFALMALVALAHALLYMRYFRYLGLFAGIGLTMAMPAFVPRLAAPGALLEGRLTRHPPRAVLLAAPAAAIAAALLAFHLAVPAADKPAHSAARLAGSCAMELPLPLVWPEGASILAPPGLGLRLLDAEGAEGRATIVATPHHRGWRGIERAYRFLDSATADPEAVLRETRATHVAICTWDGRAGALESRYPFAALLMEGRPPAWLEECPAPAGWPIRLYRYPAAGGAAASCPVLSATKASP